MKEAQIRRYLSGGSFSTPIYFPVGEDSFNSFLDDTVTPEDNNIPFGPEVYYGYQQLLIDELAESEIKDSSQLENILVTLVKQYHFPLGLAAEVLDGNKRVYTEAPISKFDRAPIDEEAKTVLSFKNQLQIALSNELNLYYFRVSAKDIKKYLRLLIALRDKMATDAWIEVQYVIKDIENFLKYIYLPSRLWSTAFQFVKWQTEMMNLIAQETVTELAQEHRLSHTETKKIRGQVRRYYGKTARTFKHIKLVSPVERSDFYPLLDAIEKAIKLKVSKQGLKVNVEVQDNLENSTKYREWLAKYTQTTTVATV